MQEEVFSIKELADFLSVSESTIRKYLQQGLKAFDVSAGAKRKHLRIRREDVDAFIETHTV